MAKNFDLDEHWKEAVMGAIRPEIHRRAEAGLEAARSHAPVETGDYRDSLSLEATSGGYVLNTGTDHSWFVEKGTRHHPGHHLIFGLAADVIRRS